MNIRDTDEFKEYGYKIVTCPVCGCETLDHYWICENCGWEYDYVTDGDGFSNANGMTLKEYRQAFRRKKRGD